MNNIFIYVSIGFGVLLLIGFGLGMLRSWKKSLIRFGILFGDLLISLFTAPAIAKLVVKKIATGTKIAIFNFNVDLAEVIEGIAGENISSELAGAESTTAEVATGLINILTNVALFVILFLSIWLLSLIIYWIVCAVVHHCKKEEIKKGEEKKRENIGLRFVGGFVGLLSMCAFCFAFLIPLFGTVDICNKFLDGVKQEETASAYSPASTVAGRLYYTEDEKIGKIETYIEKYEGIKTKYDKSFVGGLFNFTGLSKLGAYSFSYLTNVKSGNLDLSLTDESVAIISTYNAYKDTFVENGFNIKENDSVDGLINVYEKAATSEIVKSYMVELLPTMADKWTDGEKFFGISNPIDNEFSPVFNQVLQVFKVKSMTRIDSNIKTLLNVVKDANNNNLIATIQGDGNITEYLRGNTTLIKDTITTLSTTEEFRNNLPAIFNELLRVVYGDVVGGESTIPKSEDLNVSIDNWEAEANNLQNIFNTIMGLYGDVLDSAEAETNNVAQLGTFGKVLDLARDSKMLSESLKQFIIGYISSDKINFGSKNEIVKEKLLGYIRDKWDVAEFNYEMTFSSLAKTADVLGDLTADGKKPNLSDMEDVLKDLVKPENEESRKVVGELLKDENVSESLFGTGTTADAAKDVVQRLVEKADEKTIDDDIAAGQALLDVAQKYEDKEKGETLKPEEADTIVDSLKKSTTMMEMLKEASDAKTNPDPENSNSLGDVIKDLNDADKKAIADSVAKNQSLTEEQRGIFENLFGTGTVQG